MTNPRDPDGAHPSGDAPDDDTTDQEDETTEPDVTTPEDQSTLGHQAAPEDRATSEDRATPDEHATEGQDQTPQSGLRNPMAAVRGVGAGALAIEAVILLLAIVPLRVLDVRHTAVAIGCVLGIVVLCFLLAGMLRREWAWKVGIVPPILVIACGYFHFSLAIIGVLFLLVWLYVRSVRRTVLGKTEPR